MEKPQELGDRQIQPDTIGALIITYTILGPPSYNYSIMGPKTPILIIKAPILPGPKRDLNVIQIVCLINPKPYGLSASESRVPFWPGSSSFFWDYLIEFYI